MLGHSPPGHGRLSGRDVADAHRAKLNPPMFDTTNPANARRTEIVDALAKVADQAGLTLPQPTPSTRFAG
ncbi:hypothetical protein [Streptomyces sp. NPDC096132]|uniref:hypothetical protein n=1 Tax=Streptomyces sp. NPDC096132 TaxID=3366075 RepID=UPI00382CD72C